VAYRETATVVAEGEYKHVKQTGGHGQYGHVRLILEPMPPGESFEFVNEIRSGRIPAEYIASVEKGVVKAMRRGPHAGYPVVDVRVRLVDGSYHEVDSSDMAFQEAALMAFRQVFLKTQPDLLEPVMSVEVVVPEEFMGAAAGSICQRRGRIESMEQAAGARVLNCFVPLAEMFGYAGVIRTLTQGRGSFTMHFERYEAVPCEIERQIVEKRIREKRVPGA
jgi:elongation factor G